MRILQRPEWRGDDIDMSGCENTRHKHFKMKITTMRRPDGKNQYKITVPKEIMERIQENKEVFYGRIRLFRGQAYIFVDGYVDEKRDRRNR